MSQYLVMVHRSEVLKRRLDDREEYFVSLIQDPYRKGGIERVNLATTDCRADAFVFEERAAAEVIAALVGGAVHER